MAATFQEAPDFVQLELDDLRTLNVALHACVAELQCKLAASKQQVAELRAEVATLRIDGARPTTPPTRRRARAPRGIEAPFSSASFPTTTTAEVAALGSAFALTTEPRALTFPGVPRE